VLLRRRREARESNNKVRKVVVSGGKICCPSHSWRILAEKISRSTCLDDISQLEIVLSCSGGGLSYMHHEIGQGGAQDGQ